jgi:hypothetical protein
MTLNLVNPPNHLRVMTESPHRNRAEPSVGEILAQLIGQGVCAPQLPREWELPEFVDRYQIEGVLGAGGMGLVLRAYDPELNRDVALKLLKPVEGLDEAERARAHERLLREARAMARLDHPNVVAIHDVLIVDGRVYIAMALVKGPTLREWIELHKPDWQTVVSMFIDAGRGLEKAHGQGLVHRDFKPDNVLVDEDGRALVSDFGLVTVLEERPTPRVPNNHAMLGEGSNGAAFASATSQYVVGTPGYMAPEQLKGMTVDAKGDQFSFCVSLYEALYGEHPLAKSAPLTHDWHPRAPPADTEVPAAVWPILERGMAPDPNDRWETMTELIQSLSRLIDQPGSLRLLVRVGVLGSIVGLIIALTGYLLLPDADECTPGEIGCLCLDDGCAGEAVCIAGTCQTPPRTCEVGEPWCGPCHIEVTPVRAEYTSPFKKDSRCVCSKEHPNCHELYQGMVKSVNGLWSDLEFRKVSGGRPSKSVHYWVLASERFPTCLGLPDYPELVDGVWTPLDETLIVKNVPIWPSPEQFHAARPGATRTLILATGDGAGDVNAKVWFQPEPLVFTKVCPGL